MDDIKCVGDLSKKLVENYDGEWEIYFYKAANKKYKTKKVNIPEEAIRGIRIDAMERYNEKLIQALGLVEYGSFDDKDMLKSLSLKEECIEMMYQKFIDTVYDKLPKETEEVLPLLDREADGYVFIKNIEEEKTKLILGFKNKPVSKKQVMQFQECEEEYGVIDNRDFVQFSNKIDFIIYGDTLYSLDYKFEKVFWVGDFNRLKVQNILENIEKTQKVAPSGMFALRNCKLKRQLLKYDETNFDLINEVNVDILNNYGDFTLTGTQLSFEGDFNAKTMIKLFTGKLFFSDGKAWVGKKEEVEKPIEEVKDED